MMKFGQAIEAVKKGIKLHVKVGTGNVCLFIMCLLHHIHQLQIL